jgi:hypothetical protein
MGGRRLQGLLLLSQVRLAKGWLAHSVPCNGAGKVAVRLRHELDGLLLPPTSATAEVVQQLAARSASVEIELELMILLYPVSGHNGSSLTLIRDRTYREWGSIHDPALRCVYRCPARARPIPIRSWALRGRLRADDRTCARGGSRSPAAHRAGAGAGRA